MKRRAKARPKAKPRAKARPKARPRARAAPEKRYKLTAADLRPIAEGFGACVASDKITVDGWPVRFMYREAAIHRDDSGWRFLSGLESEAYINEPSNYAFYDCNTIANYDPTIVPHLGAPIGSAFEKPAGAAAFAAVTAFRPPGD